MGSGSHGTALPADGIGVGSRIAIVEAVVVTLMVVDMVTVVVGRIVVIVMVMVTGS